MVPQPQRPLQGPEADAGRLLPSFPSYTGTGQRDTQGHGKGQPGLSQGPGNLGCLWWEKWFLLSPTAISTSSGVNPFLAMAPEEEVRNGLGLRGGSTRMLLIPQCHQVPRPGSGEGQHWLIDSFCWNCNEL